MRNPFNDAESRLRHYVLASEYSQRNLIDDYSVSFTRFAVMITAKGKKKVANKFRFQVFVAPANSGSYPQPVDPIPFYEQVSVRIMRGNK